MLYTALTHSWRTDAKDDGAMSRRAGDGRVESWRKFIFCCLTLAPTAELGFR